MPFDKELKLTMRNFFDTNLKKIRKNKIDINKIHLF